MSPPLLSGRPGEIRILRLFSRLNVGGPALHVILLAAGLRGLGYDTRLVVGREAPREGNLLDLAVEKGIVCVQMDGLGREIRPLADLRALFRLYRIVRDYRPHIVHTHTAKAGVLGRLAAHLARVPVVIHTYHGHVLTGYFGRWKTALFRRIETLLVSWSDALVTVSEAVKRELVALGVASEDRIRVIPLGLELEPFAGELPRGVLRGEAGFAEEAPLVGIVGRLAPVKDIPTFLHAAAFVRESRPEVRFSIVGDGEERFRLEAHAVELGLAGSVHFHGWRRDMAAVYGDLDVVVNCSRNEGTPVALIEALAAGRSVVATAVGGTPDLLGGGSRGFLVPPGDPRALAAAILRTLSTPDDVGCPRRASRDYVFARHSVSRLLEDVDALYRELLTPRLGAA